MYAQETSPCMGAIEKRQTPITDALMDLSTAESHLDQALDHLGNRLASVLGPDVRNITEAGKDGPATPAASELHARLCGDARTVREFAQRVDALTSRLTL